MPEEGEESSVNESKEASSNQVSVDFAIEDSNMPEKGIVGLGGIAPDTPQTTSENTTQPQEEIKPDITIKESDLPSDETPLQPDFTIEEDDLPENPQTEKARKKELVIARKKLAGLHKEKDRIKNVPGYKKYRQITKKQ